MTCYPSRPQCPNLFTVNVISRRASFKKKHRISHRCPPRLNTRPGQHRNPTHILCTQYTLNAVTVQSCRAKRHSDETRGSTSTHHDVTAELRQGRQQRPPRVPQSLTSPNADRERYLFKNNRSISVNKFSSRD
ncbi:hypothetical protein RR46_06043 [Papilio xuthus]|uniref:Uncharacterized protein n=1 Tax=Papilio xuthus TaxID=66420 RepID=A0A194Q883_PAPXU|nr:hypothetical protein RR46_06043 [Papilio xuthus]